MKLLLPWKAIASFLVLTAVAALSRAQTPEEERLFLKPKKLVTVEVNTTTWTGAWKSPLAGFGSIEAKCVLPNQGCDAPAQGTPFVDASGKAKQGTVTGLSLSSTYDCYAIADPKLLKKDKCSKPVRITTLGSSTLVYTTRVTQGDIGYPPDGRRKLLQDSSTALTSRCFVGPTGNFTECIDSGLDNNTVIYDGVVDPNKQFIVFDSYSLNRGERYYLSTPSFEGLITCPLSLAGIIDPTTCMDAYTPPSGYIAENFVFDPLARRVWFVLYPNARGYSDEFFGTCAINAQGEFTGCAQAQVSSGSVFIPGSSPDASGFYVNNFTQAGEVFAFCKNDLSLPCDAVTGIVLGGDENFVASVRFLTDSVVYFTAFVTNFTTWDTTYITYRCNANNPTTFTECQKVFEASDMILELYAPANGGSNAYVVEDNFASMSPDPALKVCDVNQGTGVFENCKVVLGTEYFGGEEYLYLVTSSPIVF